MLAIFASLALARLASTAGAASSLASVLAVVAIAELNVVPFPWERALPVSTNYRVLAAMPRAAVAEFPFYGERIAFPLHAQYMMLSTTHWMPLVNGYSDYIPQDFREAAIVLDSFPSNDTFDVLAEAPRALSRRFTGTCTARAPKKFSTKLKEFEQYLRPLGSDETMTLYEIVVVSLIRTILVGPSLS